MREISAQASSQSGAPFVSFGAMFSYFDADPGREPGLVLNLPCGAGRFWPMLAEKSNRVIIGADGSESMIQDRDAGATG